MRWSLSHIPTLRETPAEAEILSHRLMLRAGLIRKLSAGTYSYLPLGNRILQKVIQVIREEMTRAGALEVLMPALQPAALWKQSGRYDQMGPEMVRFKDRHGKERVLGPTHEEVITDLISGELRSYKDLPKTLFQIQTKFRDEQRPRFGVIRSCEFLMKDAYSFDVNEDGLSVSYERMYDAYQRIFARCGLEAIPVEADTGFMGGDDSHEFMVLAANGEDTLVRCTGCDYAASKDRAALGTPIVHRSQTTQEQKSVETVETPGVSSVEKVAESLKVVPTRLLKTLLYLADDQPIAAVVRGDHEVNESKLRKAAKSQTLNLADAKTIERVTGAPVGFSGPVGLNGVKLFVDPTALQVVNAVVGANQADKHLKNVNPGRDFEAEQVADIRYPVPGDLCAGCSKQMELLPCIEVGHIFKLGTKYTQSLDANFLDEDGKEKPFIMGCYGIGVSRILPAIIETHADDRGIHWPASVAPYKAVVFSVNMEEAAVRDAGEALYQECLEAGLEVLLDDREVTGGVKLKDADLVGFPVRILLSEKTLQKDSVEFKVRTDSEPTFVKLTEAVAYLKKLLDKEQPSSDN